MAVCLVLIVIVIRTLPCPENENSGYLQKAKSLQLQLQFQLQLYQRLQVVGEIAIQTQQLIAKLPPFSQGIFHFYCKVCKQQYF